MSGEPLKSKPLRQPGQSLVQHMRQRFARDLGAAIVVIMLVGFLLGVNAALLVGRFVQPTPVASLIILLVSTAIIAGVTAWMFRRLDASEAQDKNDHLGARGERVVADALDDLKRDGYRVFHDVPPESETGGLANFDHVVIGPAGVFVVETKTRSKSESKKDNKIVVTADGRLLVNGIEPDRCPLKQAKALRAAMKAMLERETALRNIFVRGVVIFPEWTIEDRAYRNAGGDIWTLHHRAFNKWLRNGREAVRLSESDIALLASRIEDRVRS
jgi:hypothetical protein